MSNAIGAHVGRHWGRVSPFRAAVLGCALWGCGEPASGSGTVPSKEAAAVTSATSATAGALSKPEVTTSVVLPSAPSGDASATASAKPALSAGSGALGVPSTAPSTEPTVATTANATASASASVAATASASATPEPALTVQSAKQQEAAFAVWMQSAKTYKVGQSGSVEVVLVPSGEYHCNETYPYKVKLGAAPAGISYGQDVVRGASVTEKRASIRVPFTATAAGDARISGKFHFSVCTKEQCVIDSREVSATVKVE